MNELKQNSKRAKYAITLIKVVLAIDILSIISLYLQYDLLQTFVNEGEFSIEKAESNDLREQILSILYSGFFIISAITFIMWFRRAYYNLHQKISYLSWKEGWASGAWFVPILNLYRPYQIMMELYKETIELLKKKDNNLASKLTTTYVNLWFSLWIVSNILSNISFRYQIKAKSIDELITSTILNMISCIIVIPLAIITIKVIKDYSKAEPLLIESNTEENNFSI
ncbi:MAG TPA: hypothetical protein DD434_05305 [Bacteroidales bacterium]|nr:hypothetical protein [Bacteroidales bacterium]